MKLRIPVCGAMTVLMRTDGGVVSLATRRDIICREVSPDKDRTTNQTVSTSARKLKSSSIAAIHLPIAGQYHRECDGFNDV